MLYSKQVNLSAGATEATATKTYFKVNKGVISNMWITFPAGCAGLVKSGNVGIGTTSPGAKLHVANQIMVGTPDTQSLEEHRGKIFIPSRSATNKGGVISVMTYDKGGGPIDTCGEALGSGWVDVAESCKGGDWCAKLCFRYWQF